MQTFPQPNERPVLLGVLTARKADDHRLLGAQPISFRHLALSGRDAGVQVYVFRPQDIVFRDRMILGFVYDDKTDRWRQTPLPLPDIAYNRVPRRSLERRRDVRRALHWLHLSSVPVFNPGFLDKWTTYVALSRDETLRDHIPETERVRSLAQVQDALQRWPAVYLKPVGGSLGKGIIYIARARTGFRYHSMIGRHYRRGYRRNWRTLRQWLQPQLRGRRYLVQQAIERARFRDSPFDVRSITCQDGNGVWQVSGAAARVAARGRQLTHVPRGGSRCELKLAVREAFGLRADEIVQRVLDVARRASTVLTGSLPGLYGELSVDLTLDRSGHVWILECNAKPGRFDEANIRERHLQAMMAFVKTAAARAATPARATFSWLP